eukprot:477411-Prymnesium_polylepis.1
MDGRTSLLACAVSSRGSPGGRGRHVSAGLCQSLGVPPRARARCPWRVCPVCVPRIRAMASVSTGLPSCAGVIHGLDVRAPGVSASGRVCTPT